MSEYKRENKKYFFCGVGGSGMLPLAVIMRGLGYEISGSDRSHDQGRTPEKFRYILDQGIELFPQDGSGLHRDMSLVVSSAIENTIPEVEKALDEDITIIKRSELLASLFNRAENRIAVAGTSGKSTVTAMIGFLLHEMGKNPTVMNGAVFRNFVTANNSFATALSGDKNLFVIEADESDSSIEFYNPTLAILNNITFDHKPIPELRRLFSDFIGKAKKIVINLDDPDTAEFAKVYPDKAITYSLKDETADFYVTDIEPHIDGIHALVNRKYSVNLQTPGRHNLSNALAALGAIQALECDVQMACQILPRFAGVKRRLEVVGKKNGITVIDDFAHNPDKIVASLRTLKQFPGRLLILFQMHGFGPLKLMRKELLDSFKKNLSAEDVIYMPEVLYLGGTADQSYTAKDFVKDLKAENINSAWFETRDKITDAILRLAKPGDRILIMGARDDTLSDIAYKILNSL